jgi:hypothetical protein
MLENRGDTSGNPAIPDKGEYSGFARGVLDGETTTVTGERCTGKGRAIRPH